MKRSVTNLIMLVAPVAVVVAPCWAVIGTPCWVKTLLPLICCGTPGPRDCPSRDADTGDGTITRCPTTNNGAFSLENVRSAAPGETGKTGIDLGPGVVCITQLRMCIGEAPWCVVDGDPLAGTVCADKFPGGAVCIIPPLPPPPAAPPLVPG